LIAGRSMLHEAGEFWRLEEAELRWLDAAPREVDSIELKLVVPAPARKAACTALGVEWRRARSWRAFFLDTPDRALDRHGIVARVRSIAGEPDDSVVKLRPFDPGDLPPRLRRSKRLVVEIDGMPGDFVCSGALKARLGPLAVERAMAGQRPRRALFSRRQLELLGARLPASVRIDDLAVLGPVDVRRRKVVPRGLGRALAVEQWTYPDGSQILELSTRCAAHQALEAAARAAAVLRAHGVGVAGAQRSKTRATLDYFSAHDSGAA
jgi:hypothetical protein